MDGRKGRAYSTVSIFYCYPFVSPKLFVPWKLIKIIENDILTSPYHKIEMRCVQKDKSPHWHNAARNYTYLYRLRRPADYDTLGKLPDRESEPNSGKDLPPRHRRQSRGHINGNVLIDRGRRSISCFQRSVKADNQFGVSVFPELRDLAIRFSGQDSCGYLARRY